MADGGFFKMNSISFSAYCVPTWHLSGKTSSLLNPGERVQLAWRLGLNTILWINSQHAHEAEVEHMRRLLREEVVEYVEAELRAEGVEVCCWAGLLLCCELRVFSLQ